MSSFDGKLKVERKFADDEEKIDLIIDHFRLVGWKMGLLMILVRE